MKKPDRLLKQPRTAEAHKSLAAAYLDLDEATKKSMLRDLRANASDLLRTLVKRAGLPKGVSQPKVLARHGNYGTIIDKWLQAPDQDWFLNLMCFGLLRGDIAQHLEVLELIDPDKPEYEVLDRLNAHAAERVGDPIAVLSARWAAAWLNFQSETLREDKKLMEEIRAELEEEDLELEEDSLLDNLDVAAGELIILADSVANAQEWDQERWDHALPAAKAAVEAARSEVMRFAGLAGKEAPTWADRDKLEEVLDELRAGADEAGGRLKLAEFLRTLAAEVGRLVPSHRSRQKCEKHAALRDASAQELQLAADAEDTVWTEKGPDEARAWLEWVRTIRGEDLDGLLQDLAAKKYPKTAELAEDLDNFSAGEAATAEEKTGALEKAEPTPVVTPARQPIEVEGQPASSQVSVESVQQKEEDKSVSQAKPEAAPKAPEVPKQQPLPEPKEPAEAGQPQSTAPEVPAKERVQELPPPQFASVEEAAQAVLGADDKSVEVCLEGLIWVLLDRGERVLAWQTLKCAVDEKGMTDAFPVPPEILEALALLPIYAEGSTEVIERMRECLSSDPAKLFHDHEHADNRIRRLLVAAVSLLPALLDKTSNASTILRELRLGSAGRIRDIQQTVEKFSEGTVELNSTVLAAAVNQQEWQEQLDDLKGELGEFLSQAPHRKIGYTPGTQIWRHWFAPGGLFQRLFTQAINGDLKQIKSLDKELASLDIEEELRKAWKEHKGKGNLIVSALAQIRRYAVDAVRLIQRLAEHVEMSPQSGNDHRRKQVRHLVSTFAEHHQSAINDLEDYVRKEFYTEMRGRVVFDLLKQELQRVGLLLAGDARGLVCHDLRLWQRTDFARVQGLGLAGEPCPVVGDSSEDRGGYAPAVEGLGRSLLDWQGAFHRALGAEDHQAIRQVLDRMALGGADIELLEQQKLSGLQVAMARAKRELNSCETMVGEALAKGWLTPQTHQVLSTKIQTYQTLLQGDESQDRAYNIWHRTLAEIAIEIQSARNSESNKLRDKVASLKSGTVEERAMVLKVLDGGDVSLATDYLTQLEEEGALHPRNDTALGSKFAEFFAPGNGEASVSERLHAVLTEDGASPAELVKRVAAGEEICGRTVEDALRDGTARSLQSWFHTSRSRNIEASRIFDIVRDLGWPAEKIDQVRDPQVRISLNGPVFCPVPDFGTTLGGKLAVVCDVSSASAENAIDVVTRAGFGSRPVLLLWFRPIDSTTRRAFARLCHEKAYRILLVDSVLALHVLLHGDSRLRTLFDCSLPFTSITPYSTSGSTLADEMFFGRRHEIRAIESDGPSGACFVYGGRQIGKSVLLQKVAKDFDDRTGKRIALYIDLTRHTVGTKETMEDVWRIMAEELGRKDSTIFKGAARHQIGPKSFGTSVVAWLNQDRARRILLLLDEADPLLTADGENEIGNQHFDICNKLRGLMAETERRFKVVFAGLHNVQRSTMVANNPLAQLGRPVCVGPLMQNGEAREAFRLIAQPFAAAGVAFESPHVVNGILARTNYYPNLIQIVCSYLLGKVIDRQLRSNPKSTPPYMVTSEDMEVIFNQPDLRAELRKKFLLTLELDKRYQLIAYIVAFNRKDKEEGMAVDEILADAKCYWEPGFAPEPRVSADVEMELFQVLLEEMCGLGILRQPKSGVFCLRSPNVAELLGTDTELEHLLLSAHAWEVAEPYAPETFRCVMGQRSPWRSPLTSKQETMLEHPEQPVLVVAGCAASGLVDLESRLKEKFKGGFFRELPPTTSMEEFTKAIQELGKRKDGGKTILYVPTGCDWSLGWIERALDRVAKLTSNDRGAGVVFGANPTRVWQLGREWRRVAGRVGTGYLQLRPWSRGVLKSFLKDGGNILSTPENIDAIAKATGLWAGALMTFQGALESGDWQDVWLSDGTLPKIIKKGNSVAELFGIMDDERRTVLEELADAGDCDQPTLAQYLAETRKITGETVAKVSEWATVLSIVTLRDEKLCLDPFVKFMLQGGNSELEQQA